MKENFTEVMSPFESEDSWESWPALFKNLYGPSAFATGGYIQIEIVLAENSLDLAIVQATDKLPVRNQRSAYRIGTGRLSGRITRNRRLSIGPQE